MAKLSVCCSLMAALPAASSPNYPQFTSLSQPNCADEQREKRRTFSVSAGKSGGFSIKSITKGCSTCGGEGAIECPGCKGTGRNKKNGNIFERWKCYDCQGFGLKSCPTCGKGGLTPEQRGER